MTCWNVEKVYREWTLYMPKFELAKLPHPAKVIGNRRKYHDSQEPKLDFR